MAQDLKKVAITDSVEKKVLFDYIRSCYEKLHSFQLGYGVVRVAVFQDSLGVKTWYLSGCYDNRYESNLPLFFVVGVCPPTTHTPEAINPSAAGI
ncbi:MAG: hypothetical protein U0Y10_03305 [Spirosomataceae bacterium]